MQLKLPNCADAAEPCWRGVELDLAMLDCCHCNGGQFFSRTACRRIPLGSMSRLLYKLLFVLKFNIFERFLKFRLIYNNLKVSFSFETAEDVHFVVL